MASIFHEFENSATAAYSSTPLLPIVFSGQSTTSQIDTYGHVGAGIAAIFPDSGDVMYGRLDYRHGDEIEAFSVNFGYRHHFVPPVVEASLKDGGDSWNAPHDWSGFYAGFSGGAIEGEEVLRSPTLGTMVDPAFSGTLVGLQAGYNYHQGSMLFGLELDAGISNSDGGKSCPNAFLFTCGAEIDKLASVSARLGWVNDRLLVYAKGGVLFGEVEAQILPNIPLVGVRNPLFTTDTAWGQWMDGWCRRRVCDVGQLVGQGRGHVL